MNREEMDYLLMQHYARARTFWGRARLNLWLQMERMFWQCQIRGGPFAKRAIDLTVSAILLMALGPVFLVIGLLVKLEDGGPVFFSQSRTGQFGREFKMFKIRSMCLDAENRLAEVMSKNRHGEGITFKIENDPRITRVGWWLRKFSFDELPQLYNVLIGDMSLVGPRPPLPREVKRYTLADHRRLAAKPGITCIWQISGRSEIDFAGQVRLDVNYIEIQSLWTDVKILARTVPAVFLGKGAY